MAASAGGVSIIPGDVANVGICALVTVALQLLGFAIAYTCQFDTVTDFFGSTNFIIIALLTLFAGPSASAPRALALTILVVISRAELAAYLLYRVLRRGKDARFDTLRGSCPSFLFFWVFQMIWAFGVSLPVIFVNGSPAANSPAFGTAADIAGVAMFGVGLIVQAAADLQKDAFRATPEARGRTCSIGLWAYSRHPNFFGEMLMWWGAFTLGSACFGPSAALPGGAFAWGAATVISPLLTMAILLLLSGMPTAEGVNLKRYMRTTRARDEFVAYRARTSPIIPLPPPLYAALPGWFKALFLFEWPMYATDWEVVADTGARPSAAGAAAAKSSGDESTGLATEAGGYQAPSERTTG